MKKTITLSESEQPQSTHEKGTYLEDLFAEYMKDELGWDSTKTRTQMKSYYTNRGSNVDVIAERQDSRAGVFTTLSFWFLGIAVAIFIAAIFVDQSGIALAALSITLAAGSMVYVLIGRRLNAQHAWVECKNRHGNVCFDEMQKMVHQLEAYKASGDKDFKFVDCYFVSSTGYADTALKLAMDKGVTCYVLKDEKFSEVSFWHEVNKK